MMRLAVLLGIMATPAWAADAPVLQPMRDVDVTYRVPVAGGGNTSLLQRLRWSAVGHVQRVDLPTSGNWMVLDFARHRMAMVHDDSREVLDLPAPATAGQAGAGAGYSRAGADTVAGLACTQWHAVDTRGQETLACYTDDGVLLRAAAGPRVLLEAISVSYSVQDMGVFALPQDYARRSSSR